MTKVSFIVPLYNAETSIDETVESILAQTLQNFEILLIDDGSNDGTVERAKRWCEQDVRITLIQNQENKGVSAARNTGLEHACGKYIRFIDADDTIPERSTEGMFREAEKHHADLVIGIMRRRSGINEFNFQRTVKLAKTGAIDKYDKNLIYSFSVCNKLFLRKAIEDQALRFAPYKHAEDGLFLYQFLRDSACIRGYDGIAYIYNKPEFFETASTTQNLTREMLQDILDISEKILAINKKAPQEFIDNFNARILSTTLINEYYRKIWRLDDEAIKLLLPKIREYWNILPAQQRNEVIRGNMDLPIAQGLQNKEDICQRPIFHILINDTVSAEFLPKLLDSLYYQKMPCFVVTLHPNLEHVVAKTYLAQPNLCIGNGEDFYNRAIAETNGDYINIVEENIAFTSETLTAAFRQLQKNYDFVSGQVVQIGAGSTEWIDQYQLAFSGYSAGSVSTSPVADTLDALLSNKYFKLSALRRHNFYFSGNTVKDLAELNTKCRHARFRAIRHITQISAEELWQKADLPTTTKELCDYLRIPAVEGREKKRDMVQFLLASLFIPIHHKVLFVGNDGELDESVRAIYDRLTCPKTIAPASVGHFKGRKRSLFYRKYDVVIFAHMDAFVRPQLFHEGQVVLPLTKCICEASGQPEEIAAHIEECFRERQKNHQTIQIRYAFRKLRGYLLANKKIRRGIFRLLNTLLRIVPLHKKDVLFVSDIRDVLGGNLQPIYDHLPRGMQAKFEFTGTKWNFTNYRDFLRAVYRLTTCKYILLEDFYAPMEYMRVRKGQEICQLWHAAGAYKKFAHSRSNGPDGIKIHSGYRKYTKAIVSAPAIREDYAEAYQISLDRVQATGIPRTDIFFDEDYVKKKREEIYRQHPEFQEKKLILFAPTYRGRTLHDASYDLDKINFDALYQALHEEYIFVIKWHPAMHSVLAERGEGASLQNKYESFIYDMSSERDINDLLLVTDVLVTDYSSVIFDYLLVNKPIVYFTYDLDKYRGGRGLYYKFEEYVYGRVTTNTEELIEGIRQGDLCEDRREAFRTKFMSSCDGFATVKTCDFIFQNQLPQNDEKAETAQAQRPGTEAKIPEKPIQVHVLREKGSEIILEGLFYHDATAKDEELFIKDGIGNRYQAVIRSYPKEDVFDQNGEALGRSKYFQINLPQANAGDYMFVAVEETTGQQRTLPVQYLGSSGLGGQKSIAAKQVGGYRAIRSGDTLSINKGSIEEPVAATQSLAHLYLHGNRQEAVREKMRRKQQKALRNKTLNKQVAFLTIRNEHLEDNLELLMKHTNGSTVRFSHRRPLSEQQTLELYQKMFASQVVVLDDYMWLYRDYPKVPGQFLIQVWHACGAFKKFGRDGTTMFPGVDALTHQYYDLVCVSSEYVRHIYAQAFDIDIEKVQALGCPRTDLLFDEEYKRRMRKKIYTTYPNLQGKKLILYAPTFRDIPGIGRNTFHPELDFDRLSEALGEDKQMLICPHPVMTTPILQDGYDNIQEIRQYGTMEMMQVADLLITDYSSVIFEAALLGRPMVFYCPDFDQYDRDFYLDYDKELPGPLFKTEEDLLAYLRQNEYVEDEKLTAFVAKYMGACDGHSTERIAAIINEKLQ